MAIPLRLSRYAEAWLPKQGVLSLKLCRCGLKGMAVRTMFQ